MELLIPHTSTAVGIIALLASLVLLRLFVDVKEILSAQRMKRAIRAYIHQQYQPTTTVLIELRHRAETVLPLLDRLQAQHHKQLDVLIILKHTAGKNAQSTLSSFQQAHPALHLTVAKHRKGVTLFDYAHDHATGDIVMQLTNQQAISPEFFKHASLPFIDNRVAIVMPRHHITTGKSLASALNVILATWHHFFRLVRLSERPLDHLRPGLLYRRVDLARAAKATPVYRPQLALHTAAVVEEPRASLYRRRVLSLALLPVLLIITLFIITLDEHDRFFAEFFVGCYVVHFGLVQLSLRGYSISEQISLILFAPFSLLLLPLVGLRRCSAWLYHSVRP